MAKYKAPKSRVNSLRGINSISLRVTVQPLQQKKVKTDATESECHFWYSNHSQRRERLRQMPDALPKAPALHPCNQTELEPRPAWTCIGSMCCSSLLLKQHYWQYLALLRVTHSAICKLWMPSLRSRWWWWYKWHSLSALCPIIPINDFNPQFWQTVSI